MKKILFYITVLLFIFLPTSAFAYATSSDTVLEDRLTIYLFHSEECPHCRSEKKWLESYKLKNSKIAVKYYEKEQEKELLSKVRKSLGIKNSYVPLTVIGSDYFIGYNADTQKQMEEAISAYLDQEEYCDIVSLVKEGKDTEGCRAKNNGIYNLSSYHILPIIGEVNTREISLPFLSILIGFVDGFNPCAMWALIFLITMLLEMKNRKKMWILGFTFLISSALVYFLFMASWLGIANYLSSTWFRYLIAGIAIVAAIINIRKYFILRTKSVGCKVSSKKGHLGIIQQVQNIVKEKKMFVAMIGIIILAFSVNVIELACSAGLPLLFTQILSMNSLTGMEYTFYMVLYILFYLIDDIIIFVIAMTTLKVTGISNKYTKYSHLVGGIIMLLIGVLLIVKPAWVMFNF